MEEKASLHAEQSRRPVESRPAASLQPERSCALADNRPEAAAQRKLKDLLNDAPRLTSQRRYLEGVASGALQRQKHANWPPPVEAALRIEKNGLLQRQFTAQVPAQLEQEPDSRPNNTGLPRDLKSGVESISGVSLDNVNVHYNSSRPAQLNALAYAQGNDIHVAPGQERHLPHEAWHVVQQAQGRVQPTMQTRGGVAINDESGLEHEADVMGARALQMNDRTHATSAASTGLGRAPVAQRNMGMEVEIKRAVVSPDGESIAGDTPLLRHQYFTVVTDSTRDVHGVKYSNLEFVMQHFDQLTPAVDDAIAELRRRLGAMHTLADSLNRHTETIGALPGVGDPELGNIYAPRQVGPIASGYSSANATIAATAGDDGLLYVHYTIGFEPKHWFKMVHDLHGATRDDTVHSRPKTHAGHAIGAVAAVGTIAEVIAAIESKGLNPDQVEELKGHLALMYMQMSVFAERTMDQQLPSLKRRLEREETQIRNTAKAIRELEEQPAGRRIHLDDKLLGLRRQLRQKKRYAGKIQGKIRSINTQEKLGKGQVKNKIAALPRATLHEMYGALSGPVQEVLAANKEIILDAFSEHLEETLNLDLNEQFELESAAGITASLAQFLDAGLGSGMQISQQVLFGGMNEVGIHNSEGKNLLPLEFRSLFKQRVTWDELEADAIKLLRWSRDPRAGDLR